MGDYSENEFFLKFEGDLEKIDAYTLINSLLSITTIIQEANKELDTQKQIEIKIKALDRGSFEVHLELIESFAGAVKSLFTSDNVKTAKNLIEMLASLATLRKFLKKDPPKRLEKKDEKVVIENMEGNRTIVDNRTINVYIYNKKVDEALNRNFEALHADPSVTGFQIIQKGKEPLFQVEREEFADMTKGIEIIEPQTKTITQRAKLSIIKLTFEPSRTWDFNFSGFKISAYIADGDFFERIDRGEERFGKGDILDVDLQIEQELEPDSNTYFNKSYQVNKVHKHIESDQQEPLNFEPSKGKG